MESYTHNVDDIVSRLKSALNLSSDVELARVLNIKPGVLNNWKTRNSIGDPTAVINLCFLNHLDLNAIFLGKIFKIPSVFSEESTNYTKPLAPAGLPLIPFEAFAGYGKGDNSALLLGADRYVVPDFNRKADFLIKVTGTSMSPKYYSGDILACKQVPTKTFLQWGKVYIIDTEQGPICKRIYAGKAPGTIRVVSENKDLYPEFELEFKQVRSLAIVVGVIRLE